MVMKSINNLIADFLSKAKLLGLPDADYKTAEDFLFYNEYGLAFLTVVDQLYEYGMPVSSEFYGL